MLVVVAMGGVIMFSDLLLHGGLDFTDRAELTLVGTKSARTCFRKSGSVSKSMPFSVSILAMVTAVFFPILVPCLAVVNQVCPPLPAALTASGYPAWEATD